MTMLNGERVCEGIAIVILRAYARFFGPVRIKGAE
jgi:hypothetical protein